ncbi:MAG: MoaD/ThiS family protein [Rhodospirillales bacterium]|nr:MoaD/ThiS family protein [Rhodospirillales bacterium]
MVKVILSGTISQMAGGETEMEVEATSVRQIFRHLRERFPNIEAHMENDIAVAIDGTIFHDAWFEKVSEDSEVHLLPRIGGG